MIPMALSLPSTEARMHAAGAVSMDEAAFRRLYQRTVRPLRAYLARCCGDFALADDILQEAYLRFLRSGFEGEDDDHRKNYLYRIATNLMRDHFRRKRPETDEVPEQDPAPAHDAVYRRKSLGRVKKLGFVLAPARTRLARKQNAGLLVGSPSFADTASRSRSQPKMEDNLFTSP